MNEKMARQIAEAKKQTIGVEIEMNGITRSRAAKVAADFFGTGRYRDTAGRNGYCTWSAWDADGREWKFQRDVSIEGPDSEKCELVTPILTYADIETLQELVRQLRHAGAKSDAGRGCGVHIHIGAKGHTPQSLRNLANIMAGHESLIAEALNLDGRRMSRYCRTVDQRFLEQLNKKKPQTMAQLADIWYGSHGAGTTAAPITTTAGTTCSTTTPPSRRPRSSSGSSSSTPRQTGSGTASTPGSLKDTSSSASCSARWRRKSRAQARSRSSTRTPNTP